MKIKLTDIPCFYINLDKYPEKSEKTRKLLESLGFKSITRIQGVVSDSHVQGCAMSHLSILDNVSDYPFIIFEDDIDVKSFIDEIDIPDDVTVLYLGNYLHNANLIYGGIGGMYSIITNEKYPPIQEVKDFDLIYRVRDMLGTHAMLYLSKDFVVSATKLIRSGLEADREIPIDVTLAKMQFDNNIYVVKDPMFWQNDSRSILSRISTIFPTNEIKNILSHYPVNFEFIVSSAQQEINKINDIKNTNN